MIILNKFGLKNMKNKFLSKTDYLKSAWAVSQL